MQTHKLLQFSEESRGHWHGRCSRLTGRAQELSTVQIRIRGALTNGTVSHDAIYTPCAVGADPPHLRRQPSDVTGLRRRQCGARTKSGKPCRSPATAKRRRRLHGGASGSGGPPGRRNGQYRHGERTKAAIAEQRKFSALLKMLRASWGSTFRVPDCSHDGGDRISNDWQSCPPTI
jgi:glucans biosynthesis protein